MRGKLDIHNLWFVPGWKWRCQQSVIATLLTCLTFPIAFPNVFQPHCFSWEYILLVLQNYKGFSEWNKHSVKWNLYNGDYQQLTNNHQKNLKFEFLKFCAWQHVNFPETAYHRSRFLKIYRICFMLIILQFTLWGKVFILIIWKLFDITIYLCLKSLLKEALLYQSYWPINLNPSAYRVNIHSLLQVKKMTGIINVREFQFSVCIHLDILTAL